MFDLDGLKTILRETTKVLPSLEVNVLSKETKHVDFGDGCTVVIYAGKARDFRFDLLRVLNSFPQPERELLAEGHSSREGLERVLRDKKITLQLVSLLLFFEFWTHESVFGSN